MFFYFGESYQFVRGLFIKKYQHEIFAVLFFYVYQIYFKTLQKQNVSNEQLTRSNSKDRYHFIKKNIIN